MKGPMTAFDRWASERPVIVAAMLFLALIALLAAAAMAPGVLIGLGLAVAFGWEPWPAAVSGAMIGLGGVLLAWTLK